MDKSFSTLPKSRQLMTTRKIASKGAIQKTSEATDDLFGNKIAEITKAGSKSTHEDPGKSTAVNRDETSVQLIGIPKERYISTASKVSKYGVFSGPYLVRILENKDQKKLRIWTLLTQ